MIKLFLDDVRIPSDCVFYMHTRIGSENSVYLEQDWIVVRSFNEFVHYIAQNGVPDLISFDHDLATEHYEHTIESVESWEEYHQYSYREHTGYDALTWLINYCEKYNNFKYPKMIVHSMNPVGTEKMLKQINGFN